MLSKDVAIVNGMVRTKDSVKVRDAVRSGLVEVGKTLFWHGHEGDVVSVNGDTIILDIDGEKYTVKASECESGTTGDSKTKDFKTIGGTVYISKGGEFRVKERDNGRGGFEYKVENTVGDGYGGPFGSLEAAKQHCDKMDAKYTKKTKDKRELMENWNGKLVAGKTYQTSEGFRFKVIKEVFGGVGNRTPMVEVEWEAGLL